MAVTSAIAMNVTERTVIGRTVAGKSALPTLANGLGHPLVVPTMTIVAPGRLPPRGKMMKGGLQGTMIGEVAMMTEEALILTMTVAGMITTDSGTTVAGTNGTIVSRTGRGTPTGITDGLAED